MRVVLQSQDDSPKRDLVVTTDDATIGRDASCEHVVEGPGHAVVSGRHLQLRCRDQRVEVEDLRSSNGSFLNNQRINAPTPLRMGDELRLGRQGPRWRVAEIATTAPVAVDSAPPLAFLAQRPSRPQPKREVVSPRQSRRLGNPKSPEDCKRSGGSTTRLLLYSLEQRSRTWGVYGAVAAALALVAVYIFSLMMTTEKLVESEQRIERKISDSARQAKQVYDGCVLSAVYVICPSKSKPRMGSTGTGFLVDRERRWVITAYHVVDDTDRPMVLFPKVIDGRLATQQSDYASDTPIEARLLKHDETKDLALLELSQLPANAPEGLPLSSSSAVNGDTVISMGNTGAVDSALWSFSVGNVKNVERSWKLNGSDGRQLCYDAVVLDNSISQGDSGGPLVNLNGEVVGIAQSLHMKLLIAHAVDVGEIRQFIGSFQP